MKAPTILSIACFETAYLMQSSFPDYGRYDLLTAHYNRDHEFLRRNNPYTESRRKMRDRFVDKFRFMNRSEMATLQGLCRETFVAKIEMAAEPLLGDDAVQALAQDYDLEKFNGIIKIFLEDMLVYEILRQACIALVGASESKFFTPDLSQWNRVRISLETAHETLRTQWLYRQLEKDVNAAQLTERFSALTSFSAHEPAYNQEISDMLTQKYYDFTFRVTFYVGWTLDKASVICRHAPTVKCLMKNGKLVLVSWKRRSLLHYTYISITDRDDYPPVVELPAHHMFRRVYTESMLADVYGVSGYLRNLQKRNRYPALVAYVTGARSRRVTPSEISDIWLIFRTVVDTMVSVKDHFTQICMHVKQIPHYRSQRDEAFDHLETIFFEMNTRYEDIHETLNQIMTHYRTKYRTASNQLEQLTDAVRLQFHTYYENTRLYLKEEISNDDRKKLLEPFLQACTNVMMDIQKLANGLSNGKTFMETLSNESPMHAIAYLLVRLHELADLIVYGMQCTFQGHRYAIDPIYARTQDQIYEKIRTVEGNEVNMSRNIGDAMEHLTKYADNAKYGWQSKVQQELDKENSIQATNDTAQRIANRLGQTFPWNKFSVSIHSKSYTGSPSIDSLGETMYGEMFFANPDYSMVYTRGTNTIIIVNWDLLSEPEPESGQFAFNNANELCVKKFQSIIEHLSVSSGLKSFFIWRESLGMIAGHGSRQLEESNPCCGSSTSFRVYNAAKQCWYTLTPACPTCNSNDDRWKMYNYYAGIYAIGNYGDGY